VTLSSCSDTSALSPHLMDLAAASDGGMGAHLVLARLGELDIDRVTELYNKY
jgi:hypothetical protein